jgi:hypothetical protein
MAQDLDVAETLFAQPEEEAEEEAEEEEEAASPLSLKTTYTPAIRAGHHRVFTIYDSSPHSSSHSVSLFLETNAHGPLSGTLFHVIGSLNKGMMFETRVDLDPTQSPAFESRVFLGSVLVGEEGRFESVCKAAEVPGKQVRRGGGVIEKGKPVRGGREWVTEVVERLYAERMLVGCGGTEKFDLS